MLKKRLNITCLISALLLVNGWHAIAQSGLVAFPGAEGAGKFTSGGRGTAATPTTVFIVTNLNDDNNAGSLRHALKANAACRTIVFNVSGTIHLDSKLNIPGNTTIAGQTAPGDGICIADHPVVISGDNVIVRYMRFRMGDKNQDKGKVDGSGGDDTFGNLGGKNIIIDHCTSSWSSDEALTIYRGDSVTIQWCIISEPLNYSYHFETGDSDYEEHGYGGIWGSRHGSFHHNLIAHCKGRCPRFAGSSTYAPGTAGQENVDFRNNVVYNWISYSTNGGEGGNYNLVNNYYKYGPGTLGSNTSGVPKRHMIMNPSRSSSLPYPKLFITGNYVDGAADVTANNWLGIAMSSGTLADTVQSKVTTPFSIVNMPTSPATEAYEKVLQQAGASLPRKDTLDQRIINDVRNRTGRVIDVQGGYPHGTAYSATVNAWPALQSATAPNDTDKDGMPDWWENKNQLDPNNAADRNNIASSSYTMLEEYLNAIPSPDVQVQFTAIAGDSINTSTRRIRFRIDWPKKLFSFGLMRSNDSLRFTKIAELPADINSHAYTIDDNAAPAGKVFYRMVSYAPGRTDSVFSDIISIRASTITAVGNIDREHKFIRLYPNPVNRQFTLKHPVATIGTRVDVYAIDGRKVMSHAVQQGADTTVLSSVQLVAGTYTLVYDNKKEKPALVFCKN